tara:strand:- start:4004 stop:4198 length:195 start_codon:yes stop_codon:yes gene_type:complete
MIQEDGSRAPGNRRPFEGIFIMFVKKLKEIINLLKSILNHPLNQKNKFKVILKFLTFNIARRLI